MSHSFRIAPLVACVFLLAFLPALSVLAEVGEPDPWSRDGARSSTRAGVKSDAAPAVPRTKDEVADPTGDVFGAGAFDLVGLDAALSEQRLLVTLTFDGAVIASDEAGGVLGFVDLDLDRDGATGDEPWSDFDRPDGVGGATGMGNEAYVDFFTYSAGDGAVDLVDDGSETVIARVPMTFGADRLTIEIDSAFLGGTSGIDLAAIVGDDQGPSDVVPNNGSVSAQVAPVVLLHDGRYELRVSWRDFEGHEGFGREVSSSSDSAVLYFFGEKNWEILAKVLDGCSVNGHWWVFFSGSTNVEFELKVTDTATGTSKTYVNPLGHPADSVNDTAAFDCP